MAHYDVELVYNDGSRDLSTGFTASQETLVVAFCLDDAIEPVNPNADFYNYDKDVVALEFAYSILPESRWLPTDANGISLVGSNPSGGGRKIYLETLLIRTGIRLTERADNYWVATATYAADFTSGLGTVPMDPLDVVIALPYVSMNFTIGGGTRKVFKNLNFVTGGLPVKATNSTTPNVPKVLTEFGTVGFTGDTLAGADIPSFDLRVQITGYYKPDKVDFVFLNILKEIANGPNDYGTYNDDLFMGQSVGEVSLLGITGGTQVANVIPLTFEFSVIQNQSGRLDSGFPDLPFMHGHDLLEYSWFRKYDTDAEKIVSMPDIRSIHRMKDEEDYSRLGLPL